MLSLDQVRLLQGLLLSDRFAVKGSELVMVNSIVNALAEHEKQLLQNQFAAAGLRDRVERVRPIAAAVPEPLPDSA